MQLLIILFSLGFVYLWGMTNPLQRDHWYRHWLDLCSKSALLADKPQLQLVIGVGMPVVALLLAMGLVIAISYWLILPLGVAVLLYSLGRHEISQPVEAYTSACACADWQLGLEQAKALGVETGAVAKDDWTSLHEQVLQAATYRGFERLFAVLFWFLLFGPAGALLYRLSWLYKEDRPDPASTGWLWLLEWPAVRLLGISFAVTGNFVGCVRAWRISLLSGTATSSEVLSQTALGALLVDDDLQQTCAVTRRELLALQSLYNRTFWLWLGCIGVWGILN